MQTKRPLILVLCTAWLFTVVVFFILSFTQIDLNLTLINQEPFLSLEHQAKQLGYFNRPLNGLLFAIIILTFLTVYVLFVYSAYKDTLSTKTIKNIVLITAGILGLSYTAFSYDLFNYIFDARILVHYHLNPYAYKALDFPNDEWIRFMRWTHRTYPYGPVWLFITAIPSAIGFGKFLPTIIAFKVLFIGAYGINAILIYKISKYVNKDNKILPKLAVVSYALHPLILIDGLISPRIDMVMATGALAAVYIFLKNENKSIPVLSWAYLLLSIGTKFVTVLFAPLFFLKPPKIGMHKWLLSLVLLAFITTLAQSFARSLQPWYFILPVTVLCLLWGKIRARYILVLLLLCCIPLWSYIYLIYTGISTNALGAI